MDRTQQRITFLDTHIVLWMWGAPQKKISRKARDIINDSELYISSMVLLEIQYLREIGKVEVAPDIVYSHMQASVGLQKSASSLDDITRLAQELDWTRDAFDRIIVAEACVHDAYLITADMTIRRNYELAVW